MRLLLAKLNCGLLLLLVFSLANAHQTAHHGKSLSNDHSGQSYKNNPRAVQLLDWKPSGFTKVVTAGYPVSFGIYAFSRREPIQSRVELDPEGKSRICTQANYLAFDVDDDLAYDIATDVKLKLLLDVTSTESLFLGYDKHGSASANVRLDLTGLAKSSLPKLQWVEVTLPSARFANRGIQGTDLALTTYKTMLPESELAADENTQFVLCDIKLTEIPREQAEPNQSRVTLKFVDQSTDAATPVRFGLYNESGTAVLFDRKTASTKGLLPIKFFEQETHVMSLSNFYPPFQYWPHSNRYFYYSGSAITQELPRGKYQLVATKGPEYKITTQSFEIKHDSAAEMEINIAMTPWRDVTETGWFSGDVHIHMERSESDNEDMLSVLAAENLHLSNLLIMSNISGNYYSQYAWGNTGSFQQDNHAITPGVEGPRTAHRGHAIALNVAKPRPHNSDDYFLYHRAFEFYQEQGAINGYAHVGSGEFNEAWGLALDAPFGLVDFVEIMQASRMRTALWYQLLNLGFRIAPAAGSDFPYYDQPGAVRSYVKIDSIKTTTLNTDSWFRQLKAGYTFVSNGPLLGFSVNGQPMGSLIKFEKNQPLKVLADAQQNPDYDQLTSLELVHCGEVIYSVKATTDKPTQKLEFSTELSNLSSGWLAIRAYGKDHALAHSGAVYLPNKEGSSVCEQSLASNVNTMKTHLKQLKNASIEVHKELEYWDSSELQKKYSEQKPEIDYRVEKALRYYQQLKDKHSPDIVSSSHKQH